MNELTVFNNEQFGEIRTVSINDEPWFVGKDVARALGYQDAFGALKKHVDDEDKQNCQNGSFDTPRGMTIINESGLYSLVMASKLPTAKAFKRWVTAEVLPMIRKTGGYVNSEEQFISTYLPGVDEKIKTLFGTTLAALRQANAKLEEAKPKVLFADAVAASNTSILVGELAKLIKQNGVDIGQNRLFDWMRRNGYLTKRNEPTQRAMDMKLFEVMERTVNNPDGSVKITRTTKVTGKGQTYFVNKFLSA